MDFSYQNTTTLHPVALALLAVAACWMLVGPRRHALASVMVLSCFVSQAQRLVVGGFDFTMMKIMVLVGLARIVLRNELRLVRLHRMDYALFAWVISCTVAYTALHGSTSALINRLGWIHDVLGSYLVFRLLLVDWRDVETLVRWMSWISVPVAVFFLVEKATGHNVFAAFGGVEAVTVVREGRLRCQGAFAHPIIAGVFWAALLPLFIAGWWRRRGLRAEPIAACLCSALIIVLCASSTPAMAFLLVLLGFGLWPLRRWLPVFWAGGVVTLVVLHFYRDKPVWHLLSRIDLSGGSTGYYRYRLMDGAIHHFDYWWMLGAKDQGFLGTGMRDITNQYLVEGFRGGMLGLVLFLVMIGFGFGVIGRALRHPLDPYRRMSCWGLGVALGVHCASFLAVSYFGQASTVWYLTLALIAALPAIVRRGEASHRR